MTKLASLATIADIDKRLFQNLFSFNHTYLNQRVTRVISASGDGWGYGLFAAFLAWQGEFHHYLLLSALLLGFALERPIYLVLKKTIRRVRPCDCGLAKGFIVPSDQFSLPSGHSAGAFLFATVVSYFYSDYNALLFSWATCVALSRVLLGVHYPLDVALGALLGMSFGMLAIVGVMSL